MGHGHGSQDVLDGKTFEANWPFALGSLGQQLFILAGWLPLEMSL